MTMSKINLQSGSFYLLIKHKLRCRGGRNLPFNRKHSTEKVLRIPEIKYMAPPALTIDICWKEDLGDCDYFTSPHLKYSFSFLKSYMLSIIL